MWLPAILTRSAKRGRPSRPIQHNANISIREYVTKWLHIEPIPGEHANAFIIDCADDGSIPTAAKATMVGAYSRLHP
jgi:hypothetical protein